jgi:hypothetical protein
MILFLSSGIHHLTSHAADFPIKAGQTAMFVLPVSFSANACFLHRKASL